MDYKTAWKESMQCSDFQNVETDTEFGIFESDTVFRVAFEGSTSKLDWWHNLDFLKIPFRGMKKIFFVHRGFDRKYRSVSDIIMQKARLAHTRGKKIEGRGFSQGAAICQRFHEDVWFNITKDVSSIVFGCPRGFGFWNYRELKKRFVNFIRIENGGDMVTGLPPWWFLFRHQGKKIHIGKKKCFKLSAKDHLEYKENL
jgi:hypothetical protein